MKFSVFCGQDEATIKQADELYFRYKDTNSLIDFIDKYPDKDFVVQIKDGSLESENWLKSISAYNKQINGTIYCALDNINDAVICKKFDLPFFYSYPVNTFFELKGLKAIGVSFIRIGIPIFFSMHDVADFDIPLRITPNKAYENYIPRINGIEGQWIRPEDLHLYDELGLPVVCEFRSFGALEDGNPLIYERTLLDIYKNQKKWDGRLNQIIKDIGISNLNSMVDKEIGHRRLNCGHSCQLNRCHYCERALTNDEIILKYKENREKNNGPEI